MNDDRPRWHTRNVPAARNLRRPLTPTEQLLWTQLRDRRFRGLKFRRQHPVGTFVLDFYCDELGLAVEVDGGIHQLTEVRERDAFRQAWLEERGIRFVRIEARAIETDLAQVLKKLAISLEPPPE